MSQSDQSDATSRPNSAGSATRSENDSDSDSSVNRQRNHLVDELIRKRLKKMRLPKAKKPRESKFKFVSNKDQFEFNESVLNELDDIKAEGRSKRRLRSAIKKLRRRNKLIKMADKSKAGWKVVEEYLTDEVASDDADHRKIKKAEERALAKLAEEREKKKKSNESTFKPKYRSNQGERFRNASRRESRSRSDDICFRCGRRGHWQADCRVHERQRRDGFDRKSS